MPPRALGPEDRASDRGSDRLICEVQHLRLLRRQSGIQTGRKDPAI